jgi:hypothetical protein
MIRSIQIQRIIKRKLAIEQCPYNESLADLGAKEGHLQLILQSIQIQHNVSALNKGITLHDSIYAMADKLNFPKSGVGLQVVKPNEPIPFSIAGRNK